MLLLLLPLPALICRERHNFKTFSPLKIMSLTDMAAGARSYKGKACFLSDDYLAASVQAAIDESSMMTQAASSKLKKGGEKGAAQISGQIDRTLAAHPSTCIQNICMRENWLAVALDGCQM